MITNSIKEKLLPLFSRYKSNVLFVYLFGSVAQANIFPLSDVDTAVSLCKRKEVIFYGFCCKKDKDTPLYF